jgi:hypothetical protein
MEPSADHYDDFTGVLPDPGADPDDTEGFPYYVPIDAAAGTKVRWMEYECSPSGFSHFGTEWDWLDFYWNMYTDGYPNRYTIDEINDVWANLDNTRKQVLCCPTSPVWPPSPFPPSGCVEQRAGTCASGRIVVEIGFTWIGHDAGYSPDSLAESVYNIWHSANWTKYNNFLLYGDEAGVNY